MRAVADVFDDVQGAGRQVPVQELADGDRRDQVVAALQDQGRDCRLRHVGTVVGSEGHAGQVLGDIGVVAAEAAGQFLAQVGPVGRAHDGRRHAARPAEVIRIHRFQQFVDVLVAEAAGVVTVVDVARRGAHHDLRHELFRRLDGGQQADHGADRVSDEHHGTGGEGIEDLKQVVGIAVQAAVFLAVVGGEVRAAAADQVEGDGTEAVLVGRREEAPHGLVTSEPMRKYHGRCTISGNAHVVAKLDVGAHRS